MSYVKTLGNRLISFVCIVLMVLLLGGIGTVFVFGYTLIGWLLVLLFVVLGITAHYFGHKSYH